MLLGIPLVVSLVLLVCFWLLSDAEVPTKIIFTIIWVVGVGGLFTELGMLFAVLLMVVDGLLWWLTFGPNLPSRRI
jgi:hypothetical protein